MNNLSAELERAGVTAAEAGRLLRRGSAYTARALSGESEFTFGEVVALRNAFFPGSKLEYLLSERESGQINSG